MTPEAAIYQFMSSFGIPAYAATATPSDAEFPYITYDLVSGRWNGGEVNMPVNVWYRTESEATPNAKVREIREKEAAAAAMKSFVPCAYAEGSRQTIKGVITNIRSFESVRPNSECWRNNYYGDEMTKWAVDFTEENGTLYHFTTSAGAFADFHNGDRIQMRCTIGETKPFKGVPYTLPQLLRDPALAGRFSGGTLLLFRLSVSDYHRSIWSLDGIPEAYTRIPGVYHTVHPTAAAARAIYRENTREYSLQHTDRFGDVAVMEVGALLVGRIENHPLSGRVARGQEKGFFAYGGSTILMLLEPGRVEMDQDLLDRSVRDQETPVRLGQTIGRARD